MHSTGWEDCVCDFLFITHHMGSHTLSSGDSGHELGVGDIEPVFGSRAWLSVYSDCGHGDCVWFCGQACHRQWHEDLGSEYDLGMEWGIGLWIWPWHGRQACHRQQCEELGREYDLGMADKLVLDSLGLVNVTFVSGFSDKPVTDSGMRNWVVNMTLAWQTSLSQTVVWGIGSWIWPWHGRQAGPGQCGSGECDLCVAVTLSYMAVWKRDTGGEDDNGVAGSQPSHAALWRSGVSVAVILPQALEWRSGVSVAVVVPQAVVWRSGVCVAVILQALVWRSGVCVADHGPVSGRGVGVWYL